MRAPARRELVRWMSSKGLSERAALRVIAMSASALRYRPRQDRNGELRATKLWALCAERPSLSPDAHAEKVFKAILGNCQSIVNNLASIRNKIGDAHVQGRKAVRAKPRHAELAVNLAGTMASFLVATWVAKTSEKGR